MEINSKYRYLSQLQDLETKLEKDKIEGYKKDAVIAKVTTENEQLLREVAWLRNVRDIDASIATLPGVCFSNVGAEAK